MRPTIIKATGKEVNLSKNPIIGAVTAPPTIVVQRIPATAPSSFLSNEFTHKEKILGNIIDQKKPTKIKQAAETILSGTTTAKTKATKAPIAYNKRAFEVFK